jgi:hypothetical protein
VRASCSVVAVLVLGFVAAPACRRPAEDGDGLADAGTHGGGLRAAASAGGEGAAPAAAATPLALGDWRRYPPAPAKDGPLDPLDDARWALLSAELGCAGASFHGDPDSHRAAARAILHHHRSSAQAVMDYGVAVNGDPAKALRLGEQVALAVERCRVDAGAGNAAAPAAAP